MQQAYLDVNGVRTSVVTIGRWVEESPESDAPEDIILIIPGNPGVTGFYKMLMQTLYEKTGYPVWAIGHAGHEVPKNNRIQPIQPWTGNEELFNLQGQIEHKKQFIKQYVPPNARLHLVGHSIGGHMSLQLLDDPEIEPRVARANLVFSTIERMAETSNGKFLTRFIFPIVSFIVFMSAFFTMLPAFLRTFMVYVYMKITGMPRNHAGNVHALVKPSVLEKVFYLAVDELVVVKSRNDELIRRNLKKLKLVYGKNDGWAPQSFCDKLKRDIPEVDAVCTDFDHTFVLKQSRDVGNLLVESWNQQ